MKTLVILTFFLFNLNFVIAADVAARWIDIEWSSVEGAAAYEISLSEVIDSIESPRGIFSTDTASWSKEVNPGNYKVRIRTLDKRKVPGAWGEPIPVIIKQEDPQQLVPLDNEKILKNETGKTSISFQWAKVYGIQEYTIRVYNDKGAELLFKQTNETEITLELDDINDYFWLVTTGGKNQIQSPKLNELKRRFSIRGEKLKSPVIEVDSNHPKGIYLKWPDVYRAIEYEISLSRLLKDKNELVKKFVTKKPLFGLGKTLIPQGKWVLAVVAKSNLYKNSDISRIIFNTEGKKTEVITNESTFKETNYRNNNSSLVSMKIGYPTLIYQNINYETDTTNQQTLRGVQVSLNHSLPLLKSFNINSHLSFGQFADSYTEVTNYNLSSGIRKLWAKKNLKFQTGLSLGASSTPLLSSNRLESTIVTKTKFISLYPELNLQLNYKITEHLEIEFLTKLNMSVINLQSSKSGELEKSMNKSLALKMIYNINSKFNFSVGINSLEINNRTLAKIKNGSFAILGDINETKIQATFFDFGIEYFY